MAEIAREAIDRCLDSCGLTFDDIDAVVAGNMEMFEGIYLVDQYFVGALGALGKPLYKLNTGGTVGASAALACYHLVASGRHRRVLGVGFQKQSEGSTQSAITTVGDPVWERAVMAGAIGNFASMASTYIAESGVTQEQAAKVAVKARRNACLNPHAHLKLPDITVEQVLESEMLAFPIHRLDFCPSSDGACAIVVAAEDLAGDLVEHPAWVHAVATAHDQQYMGDSPQAPGGDALAAGGGQEGLRAGRDRGSVARLRRRGDLRARLLRRAGAVREPLLLRHGRRRPVDRLRA